MSNLSAPHFHDDDKAREYLEALKGIGGKRLTYRRTGRQEAQVVA